MTIMSKTDGDCYDLISPKWLDDVLPPVPGRLDGVAGDGGGGGGGGVADDYPLNPLWPRLKVPNSGLVATELSAGLGG